MKSGLFPTLQGYKKAYLPKDIWTGIMIAAVSIPISMGYAEVSGLPAVYGLYGSVFPILFFAVFSTSRQFIFGVDAAPAALVGAALAALGIPAGSGEAMVYVPMIALFTGLWLLLFYALKAGRIVDFISTPVMGGFISGIGIEIISMQIPKLLGGKAGTGEFPELVVHIFETLQQINPVSLALGAVTLIVILTARKFIPRFPMAIVMMAAGVAVTAVFQIEKYGVTLLSQVEPGLPALVLPDFGAVELPHVIGRSLMIAAVVMSETLLSENDFAFKNGYKIDDNREILACAAGNVAAAFVGCCPVNGSISRTSMNDQYGGKTQVVSIAAGVTMACLLVFGTGFIGYLPVPVLTAIVISALMKVVEVHLAVRLFRISRREFYIFLAAMGGVLLLGTIYGVLIGMMLSFAAVIVKATNPPRTFLGVIPGREGFYDLAKNRHAYPLRGILLYRFHENLFFANIKIFQEDIDSSIQADTKAVIVDAASVNSMDITAADRLKALAHNLEQRGIRFYITEHAADLNEQMRSLGAGSLIEKGKVRRTITAALHDMGVTEPYELEGLTAEERRRILQIPAELEHTMEEFSWAFGHDTVEEIEKRVKYVLQNIHQMPDIEQLAESGLEQKLKHWKSLGAIDEDELLRRLEMHLDELPEGMSDMEHRRIVLQLIEKRRHRIVEQIEREHPEVLEALKNSRKKLEMRLKKQNPEAARRLHDLEERLKQSE